MAYARLFHRGVGQCGNTPSQCGANLSQSRFAGNPLVIFRMKSFAVTVKGYFYSTIFDARQRVQFVAVVQPNRKRVIRRRLEVKDLLAGGKNAFTEQLGK